MLSIREKSSLSRILPGLAVFLALLLPSLGAAQATGPVPQEISRIHDNALVLDAHADIMLPNTPGTYLSADGTSKVSPDKLAKGNVDAVVMAVAVGPTEAEPRKEAEAKLQAAGKLVADNDALVLATSADQVESLHHSGKRAIILGFQNARILEGNSATLDYFYDAGVRLFALTHLGHNDFADSSRPLHDPVAKKYEPVRHGGLSELGRDAIRRINRLGGIVDISQLSKTAALQAINLSTAPIVASHSNARGLSDFSRNLSDEEIDLIGKRGGVIHVAVFSGYLVDNADPDIKAEILAARRSAGLPDYYSYPFELYWEITDNQKKLAFLNSMRTIVAKDGHVERLVDHIDYIGGRIGIEHVGIGSDFNHGGGIRGFVDASEARNLTAELLKRGYSEADVYKIWSGNFLRVWRAAESGGRLAGR